MKNSPFTVGQCLATISTILLAVLVGLTYSEGAKAQTGTGVIRVAPGGNDVAGCGSEVNPCGTIQFALNAANSGETIKLAAGTYTAVGGAVVFVDSDTNSPKILTIAGGYSINNWDTANPAVNISVIDGQNARRGVYIDARNRGSNISLQNLTIRNGRTPGSSPYGGGLYCVNNGTVSLANVTLQNNIAQGAGTITAAGGGAGFFHCSVSLQDVLLRGNQALGGDASPRGGQALGGGLFATDRSNVNGVNVTADENRVIGGSGGVGYQGDIFNRADSNGGGISIGVNTTANFTNLILTENLSQAGNGSAYGGFASSGGLFVEDGAATVNGGLIQANQAVAGTGSGGSAATGGGAMVIHGQLTLNQVSVINNTAQGKGPTSNGAGGGLYVAAYSVPTTLTGNNVIVAGNLAAAGNSGYSTGGGLGLDAFVQVNVTLNHATFSENRLGTTALGNAINLFPPPNSNATIRVNYSIIANHSVDKAIRTQGGSTILNYTLWHNNAANFVGPITNNNPLNGNPQFVDPGSPDFDYHLQNTSTAALDKAIGSTSAIDIDNQKRPYNGINDIGADEYLPPLSGSSKSAEPKFIQAQDGPNHTVDYTIIIKNSSSQAVTGASLTDTPPTPPGPLSASAPTAITCSSGICGLTGNDVTWSGNVPGDGQVTLTYSIDYNVPTNYTTTTPLVNNAALKYNDGGGPLITQILNATVLVNAKLIYLPVITK